ncbi:MAG: tRNA-binding protein, partial [Lactobacillaceae bacterium]|nr:tRNA-binding protein [Lactobacillaceae bacterium]
NPKFVIGHVEKMEDHPDSDHLHVVQVNIGEKSVQLVSGSPNMQEGIYVVVVLPGAIMPSGQIIWPGQLRGVDSFGMIASARELRLNNAPDQPGALILPEDFGKPGDAFDFNKGDRLL